MSVTSAFSVEAVTTGRVSLEFSRSLIGRTRTATRTLAASVMVVLLRTVLEIGLEGREREEQKGVPLG